MSRHPEFRTKKNDKGKHKITNNHRKRTRFYMVMFQENEHAKFNVKPLYNKMQWSHPDENIVKLDVFAKEQPTKEQFNCDFDTIHIDSHGNENKIFIPYKNGDKDDVYDPSEFANWLCLLLKLKKDYFRTHPLIINFLSCCIAGTNSKRAQVSPENSFAYRFCAYMNNDLKIKTVVIARQGTVYGAVDGRKVVATDEKRFMHKAPNSKFRFKMYNDQVAIEVEKKEKYEVTSLDNSGAVEKFSTESTGFVPYGPQEDANQTLSF